MARMVSKLRDARNAGLVTHAAGTQLDSLAQRLGVPRPASLSREAWRRALSAANGYRGLPNATQSFLEGALSDFATKLDVVLEPSRPTQLRSAGAAFTQDLVGRTVRVGAYGIFRVVGPADVGAAPFRNEILDLCPVSTPSWQAPSWDTLERPVEAEAEFHAFLVREDQAGPRTQQHGDLTGTVTVYVLDGVVASAPSTFLQPLPEDLPALDALDEMADYPLVVEPQPVDDWPPGVPSSGWLIDLQDDDLIEGGDGPWPAFLADEAVLGELATAMRNMLNVGFKIVFRPFPPIVPEAS